MRLFLDEFYASIIRSVQIKESPVFVIEWKKQLQHRGPIFKKILGKILSLA